MPFRANRPFPRMGRTLPPAASPFSSREIFTGLRGCFRGRREVARFQGEVRDYFQVRHCFPVSSGKTALLLLLQALQLLRPGCDEVIIPAFTCFSVPSAIIRAGLRVTLCDNDLHTLDFDFYRLKQLLGLPGVTSRLLCVLPTHLYGLHADVGRLQEMLRTMGLAEVPVIEDVAQAMGATDQAGVKLGTRGDAGFFSLGRGKSLSLGGGGIIITDRDDLAQALAPLTAGLAPPSVPEICRQVVVSMALTFLIRPAWFWLPKALPWLKLGETFFDTGFANRQLSAFQAGLSRSWPAKLKRLQSIRAGQAAGWTAALPPGLSHYSPAGGGNLIRFPVRMASQKRRDGIVAESNRRGFGVMPGYPASVAGIAALKGRVGGLPVPNAVKLAEHLLTLPMHRFVTTKDRQRTAALLGGRRAEVKKTFSLAESKEI